MAAAADGTSVMVIRVWREDRSDSPFRARILLSVEPDASEPDRVVLTSPGEVVRMVERWLAEFTGSTGT
jgi:hypothetical protein